MAIDYLEASSMKELHSKIVRYGEEAYEIKWDKFPRGINQLVIEKDGDKFCAIVSTDIPLVRGRIDTYAINQVRVWIEGVDGTLPVDINAQGTPRVSI